MNPRPMLGLGRVWHARQQPVKNCFHYASYFMLLPMRAAQGEPVAHRVAQRWGPLSFDGRDHGIGQADPVPWLDGILRNCGVTEAKGPLWLQTYPRVLGYAFKPVSFWLACDTQGTVQAVVAEVNNTFGERHCYVMKNPAMDGLTSAWADKVFHVSPFCSVEGQYAFRFLWPQDQHRLSIEVDLHQHGQLVLRTGIGGQLQDLTPASAWRAFWAVPLMTFGVVLRIHWQAMRLALKRVPFFRKPPAPHNTVT